MSNWGKAHENNSIGFGQGSNNTIGWGSIYEKTYSGDTILTGVNLFKDATVAFSLRDLFLGAESVVRVRRDSDNAEQDFTATEITDGTLTSFCGAGDGFVSVWYDQNGGNNAAQNTASRQPKIVDTGGLILENGKPSLNFNSSLLLTPRVIDTDTFLTSVVYTPKSPSGFETLIAQHNGGADTQRTIFAQITDAPEYGCFFNNGDSFVQYSSVPYQQDVMVVQGMSHGGGNTHININNTEELVLTGESIVPLNTDFSIGARRDASAPLNGTISEVIAYNNFIAQRRTIYDNQISYYGIS